MVPTHTTHEMSFVPESHPLLVEPRTSDASPATAGAATSPSGRSWVKLAAVGAVGLGAVVGVVSLLPTDHVNKTYAALQAKAATEAASVVRCCV